MISAAHPGGRYFYLCVIANQNSCHCEPVRTLAWQSLGSSSAPIVEEGHRPSRDVTPYTEARWFRGITGGSLPRPYKGAAEMLRFSLCTNFLPYPTCRRSSSVSPKGISLPQLRCRSAAPSSEGAMAAATPGSSSAPIVGAGHCPSRDVTPDTEVRWFYGIVGGATQNYILDTSCYLLYHIKKESANKKSSPKWRKFCSE